MVFVCSWTDILWKKLAPDGSVLAFKILLKDTFSVLMILCLGLKDTLEAMLNDVFCAKWLCPGLNDTTQEVLNDTPEYQRIKNEISQAFGRKQDVQEIC